MVQGKSFGLILLMAGSGERFGSSIPKQFADLKGKPVYLHTLDVFTSLEIFDTIILMCRPDFVEKIAIAHPFATVVPGGATRQESVYLGLQAIVKPLDIVVVHDAVRPFVSPSIILQNIEGAILHDAVDTCIPSADTIVFAPQRTHIQTIPNRREYLRGQTPQTFRLSLLQEAHEKALRDQVSNQTDDCSLVLRLGHPVFIVPGSEDNIKITTHFDLLIANSYIDNIIKTK